MDAYPAVPYSSTNALQLSALFGGAQLIDKLAKWYGVGKATKAAGKLGNKMLYGRSRKYSTRKLLRSSRRYRGGYRGRKRVYGKYSRSRAGTTRRKRVARSKFKRLKKEVSTLKKESDATIGTLVYRNYDAGYVRSTPDHQVVDNYIPYTVANLKAVLAQLKYYDPANPGTLTTANGETGTYARKFLFKKGFMSATFRNSYQTGCTLTVYLCTAKDDSSSGPKTAWENGIQDASNMTDTSDIGTFPSDSSAARELWSWKKLKQVHLNPGQSTTCTYTVPSFQVDPSVDDLQNEAIIPSHGGCPAFCFVVKGDTGHAGDGTNYVTALAAGVDVTYKTTYTVEYSAGVNIKYFHTVNGMSAGFGASVGVEGMHITDNQVYTAA